MPDPQRHLCNVCGTSFGQRKNLNRHVRVKHENNNLTCDVCGKSFNRQDNLARHKSVAHSVIPPPPPLPPAQPINTPSTVTGNGPKRFDCTVCVRNFSTKFNLQRHMHNHTRRERVQQAPLRNQAGGGEAGPSTSGAGTSGGGNPPSPTPSSDGGNSVFSPGSPASSMYNNNDSSRVGSPHDSIPDDLAPEGFEEYESGFHSRLKTYRLCDDYDTTRLTIPELLVSVFDQMVGLMRRILDHVHAIKCNLWLDCEFTNVQEQTCRRSFKTKNVAVFRGSNFEEICGDLFQKLVDEKEACEMKGSGWTFARILDMEIRVNVYSPIGGSSFIPLPEAIKSRRAVLNVVNTDQRCFEYAVLTRYIDNPFRGQLFQRDFTPEVKQRANLDFSDLEFPVTIEKISKFEKKNGVSVNVYGLDSVRSKKRDGTGPSYQWIVFPLRVAKEEELYPDHYDLLYLTDDDTTHYAYIKDFARLVHKQITRLKCRIHVCKRCFAHFDERPNSMGINGVRKLAEHRRYCKEHAPIRTDLSEKTQIKFERFERTQRARFTIYADFECALVPIEQQPLGDRQVPDSTVDPPDWDLARTRPGLPHHHQRRGDTFQSASVTTRKIHKPYAYAYFLHDSVGRPGNNDGGNSNSALWMHKGPDAAKHFMDSLRDTVKNIGDILFEERRNTPQLTVEEEARFQAATMCCICKKAFTNDAVKVRDHQHSPPYKYRGAAHSICNLRHREQVLINCYFHNLSNYDAHFIVRELGVDSGDVSVLANTEEKYISFTKRFVYPGAGRHQSIRVRFIDSFRFLSKALSGLVSILPREKLINTRKFFPDPGQFELVCRKGVFPYEYVNSLEVLEERVLPPRAAFHDNLRMEDISTEDYEHAKRVWIQFGCRTLGDYSDVYLKTDVLLLTDVFESFRDMCLHHYGLDPAHWITLPSFSWDVMLYKTNVTLDTLQDIDMYLFFEKGIRGGLAQCVTRHEVADNKFTRGEGFDAPGRDSDTHIMYYDANNLYGWAMSQPLPYGEFRWLAPEEITSLDIESIPENSEVGYVLEVDLEYPRDHQIHDRHRDLPFLPELKKAPANQLPYSRDVLRGYSVGKSKKLMATLMDKEEYVVHYRLLQQALENGLRIRHVHRVLQFRQSAWLKPYVSLNTELRRQAQNKFEVELFKLMVNAVYGMSLQNVRKHIDIRLATNPRSYTKYVAKSNFVDRTWYREDLALIHMGKVRVVLDKPVYAGMTILDHSKWWMYGFHYEMVDRYGVDRLRLLYQDTDSLIYSIRTRDVYRDMLGHADVFDTSNYPVDHPCYDQRNARVLGKFKDEAGGQTIKEFIGLMAKLYCIEFHRDADSDAELAPPPIKRAKGVNRAVVAKHLTADDYRRCLFDQAVKHTANERFQSRHHNIFTVSVTKRSMAPFDDKRYVVPSDQGGVLTLPWDHYEIHEPPPMPGAEQDEDDDVPM